MNFLSGHVGPPLACNLVKLVDVPEMDYYAKDNKGEVRKIKEINVLERRTTILVQLYCCSLYCGIFWESSLIILLEDDTCKNKIALANLYQNVTYK